MYHCVRCGRTVALDDALSRSYTFGHCVCLRCHPAAGRAAETEAPAALIAAVERILATMDGHPSIIARAGACTLCGTDVPADDVAVATPRRCLCLRCLNRIAGRSRSVPFALRTWIARILDEIQA